MMRSDARKRLEAATQLVADAPDLRARLHALHRPTPDGQWCTEDGFTWPCKTARILDEEGRS